MNKLAIIIKFQYGLYYKVSIWIYVNEIVEDIILSIYRVGLATLTTMCKPMNRCNNWLSQTEYVLISTRWLRWAAPRKKALGSSHLVISFCTLKSKFSLGLLWKDHKYV